MEATGDRGRLSTICSTIESGARTFSREPPSRHELPFGDDPASGCAGVPETAPSQSPPTGHCLNPPRSWKFRRYQGYAYKKRRA